MYKMGLYVCRHSEFGPILRHFEAFEFFFEFTLFTFFIMYSSCGLLVQYLATLCSTIMAARFDNLPFPNCDRTVGCYCRSCNLDRYEVYVAKGIDALGEDLHNSCLQESHFVQHAFSEVLKQISISKAFKKKVKDVYHYQNIACFFKTVLGNTKEEAKTKANKINNNCLVYDDFQKILNNLSECPFINVRRLSANHLFLARGRGWWQMYNEMQRGRSDRPANLSYGEADFQDLILIIRGQYKGPDI